MVKRVAFALMLAAPALAQDACSVSSSSLGMYCDAGFVPTNASATAWCYETWDDGNSYCHDGCVFNDDWWTCTTEDVVAACGSSVSDATEMVWGCHAVRESGPDACAWYGFCDYNGGADDGDNSIPITVRASNDEHIDGRWNIQRDDGEWVFSTDQDFTSPERENYYTVMLPLGHYYTVHRMSDGGNGGISMRVRDAYFDTYLLRLDGASFASESADSFYLGDSNCDNCEVLRVSVDTSIEGSSWNLMHMESNTTFFSSPRPVASYHEAWTLLMNKGTWAVEKYLPSGMEGDVYIDVSYEKGDYEFGYFFNDGGFYEYDFDMFVVGGAPAGSAVVTLHAGYEETSVVLVHESGDSFEVYFPESPNWNDRYATGALEEGVYTVQTHTGHLTIYNGNEEMIFEPNSAQTTFAAVNLGEETPMDTCPCAMPPVSDVTSTCSNTEMACGGVCPNCPGESCSEDAECASMNCVCGARRHILFGGTQHECYCE